MDKFMDSVWFMRIVALLLALLLFITVKFDDSASKSLFQSASSEDIEVIEDVPLEAYYDSENLVVTGLPQTVDVTISGPTNIVQSAKALKDFSVFVDLNELIIGEHTVQVQYEDLSEKLEVTIDPSFVTVDIQEKISVEYTVEPEFNEELLEDGYELRDLTISPNKVTITGAKNVIDKIAFVRATVDLKGSISQTVSRAAQVQVLDQSLSKLNVQVEPELVDITISVFNPQKEVGLEVNEVGTLRESLQIKEITTSPENITIFGNQSILNGISTLNVDVDLTDIEEDTTIEVPVSLPDGINQSEPQVVEVIIDVEEKEEKTLLDIPIEVRGVSEGKEVTFLSPTSERTNLTIVAFQEVLDGLSEEDFILFVDLSPYEEEGEYDVNIEVDSPEGINWTLKETSAKISIENENSTT
ncbi:hypothetical protein Q75_13980 [Bacillus coahuilensis p1.1.43]|uniref:YbbR-like domain-containing protein YbbR n=1 Tax=Bacillus coahuilensis p1.1.43 TaxID=1150625 RepID=A0A147K5L5_9BACI|nr:CdaR family protein [Bacillus coahuilensis]KUP04935.1 hypothetical protein Q75_13980 [Bacillus coahuilensis p1.1.43]